MSADSWADLEFRDGATVTLSGQSRLTISEKGRKTLHLRSGNLSADVAKQPHEREMVILTPTAKLDVLGTQLNVATQPALTKRNVNRGRVRFTRLVDGTSVDVPAEHQAVASVDRRSELKAVYCHTWVHTCLTNGRILVESMHPEHGWGYYLMTPKPGGTSKFERIDCAGMDRLGLLCRISLSPSEKKICFGHLVGHKFRETAHAICIADFDGKKRAISNVRVIANNERKEHWYAYPRWTKDESAVVYHANTTGKGALFLYSLKDETTQRVSTDPNVDYRYPHGEAAPK